MIKFIWNLLALLGLAVVAILIAGIVKYPSEMKSLMEYDEQAFNAYADMGKTLLETGNGAEATVWKVAVQDGLTAQDVEETMKFVANEHNFKNVGELPLYKEIEAMSGEPSRFIKIYMFCNAMTAARMLAYSDAYSAYLPCRITLIEDSSGKLWLYTLNMDLMIHGGKELPPELKEEALQVKEIVLDIINRGAAGDF